MYQYWSHHKNPVLDHLSHPKKIPHVHLWSTSFLPQPHTATNLLTVSLAFSGHFT